VLLRNDPVFADVVFACRTAGVYYCPINWHFTAEEVRFLLEDSGARVLIVDADLLEPVRAVIPAGVTVLTVNGTAADAIAYESWLDAQLPYDGPRVAPRGHLAYTSGSADAALRCRAGAGAGRAASHRGALPCADHVRAAAETAARGTRAL
jgi:long-chain acyl-CoA synthetase